MIYYRFWIISLAIIIYKYLADIIISCIRAEDTVARFITLSLMMCLAMFTWLNGLLAIHSLLEVSFGDICQSRIRFMVQYFALI